MKQPVFCGSATAIITPYGNDCIDLERLKNLLEFQAKNGTQAIVLAGTTGENATMDIHEYESLLGTAIAYVGGEMKMIAGIGGNNTKQCLEKARLAASAGADALLMSTPYYNKTTQAGLIEHFTYVADRIDLPLILYNVPSRTGIGITAETYKALSSHPNINGTKEASGDFSLIARTCAECGTMLNIWSGNDDQTIPMMALGAKGVVSVASNAVPAAIADLCSLCLKGEYSAASALYSRYAEFIRLLFIETNPIPIKAAMSILGFDSGKLRLPLVPMSEKNRVLLQESMEKLKLVTKA